MGRYRFTPTIAATLVVAAIIVSCSGGSEPIAPTDGLSPTGASLQGGGWTQDVANAAARDDKVAVCHSGNGKNYTTIEVSAQGAREHLGEPGTGKGGHPFDFRVSALTPCPPSADPGLVRVCKVADGGIAVGTPFTFTLTSDERSKEVTIAAGAAPTGTCLVAGEFRVGALVVVRETPRSNVRTASIFASPAGAQQGTSELALGRASVIAGAGTTTLTFINTLPASSGGPTGTLVICKIGGTGVAAGTPFTFRAGGQTTTIEAGAAPEGSCKTLVNVEVGTIKVQEGAVTGTRVTAVTGTPTPTNIDLVGGVAYITVATGQTSRITFTNTKP